MYRYIYLTAADGIRDMLEHGYEQGDTFKDARDSISMVGASAFRLVTFFAVAVIAVSFLAAAIRLSGDPAGRAEGKERMIRVLFAAAGVFGILALIDLIGYIVQSGLAI